MAKKQKHTKSGDLVGMIVVGGAAYLLFADRLALPVWILLGISALGVWFLFIMPTRCDVLARHGQPCRNPVKGKLTGCRSHDREKRDAIFAMFNLRNPGQFFRFAWSAPQPVKARQPGTQELLTVSRNTAYEAIILVCTLLSTLAAVTGTTFTAIGLLQA